MRSSILLAFLLAATGLLFLACDGDDIAVPPTIDPTTAAPEPTATPDQPRITPENASLLEAAVEAALGSPGSLVWRDDSSALLVYGSDTVVQLSNTPGAQPLDLVTSLPQEEQITALDGGEQGFFLTLFEGTKMNLRRLYQGDVLHTLELESQTQNAALSPDASVAAVQRLDAIAVDLLQLPVGEVIDQLTGFETAAPVYSVRFGPDGQSLIWLSRGKVQVMDIASGELGPAMMHEQFVSGLALSPDGSSLATVAGEELLLWDPAAGEERDTAMLPATGVDVSFSPDGALLAASTTNGIEILDAASLETIASLGGNIRDVEFAPDGRSLAWIDESGEVTIWKVP